MSIEGLGIKAKAKRQKLKGSYLLGAPDGDKLSKTHHITKALPQGLAVKLLVGAVFGYKW